MHLRALAFFAAGKVHARSSHVRAPSCEMAKAVCAGAVWWPPGDRTERRVLMTIDPLASSASALSPHDWRVERRGVAPPACHIAP